MESYKECSLTIEALPPAKTLADAWALLPSEGTGVLVLADRVARYNSGQRSGLLLEAEVVSSSGHDSYRVHSDGPVWGGWKWTEASGHTHRYVEHQYLSSETPKGDGTLVYRQYWTLKEDDGLKVWQPVGARFCGFKEKQS